MNSNNPEKIRKELMTKCIQAAETNATANMYQTMLNGLPGGPQTASSPEFGNTLMSRRLDHLRNVCTQQQQEILQMENRLLLSQIPNAIVLHKPVPQNPLLQNQNAFANQNPFLNLNFPPR